MKHLFNRLKKVLASYFVGLMLFVTPIIHSIFKGFISATGVVFGI
jgi:hypothetical protein